MRKNTKIVLAALVQGKPCRKCEAVWTDGFAVYSYAEPIAAPDPANPGGFVITEEKFSVTTSQQTGGVAFGLSYEHGVAIRNAPHSVVKAAAKASP